MRSSPCLENIAMYMMEDFKASDVNDASVSLYFGRRPSKDRPENTARYVLLLHDAVCRQSAPQCELNPWITRRVC